MDFNTLTAYDEEELGDGSIIRMAVNAKEKRMEHLIVEVWQLGNGSIVGGW